MLVHAHDASGIRWTGTYGFDSDPDLTAGRRLLEYLGRLAMLRRKVLMGYCRREGGIALLVDPVTLKVRRGRNVLSWYGWQI